VQGADGVPLRERTHRHTMERGIFLAIPVKCDQIHAIVLQEDLVNLMEKTDVYECDGDNLDGKESSHTPLILSDAQVISSVTRSHRQRSFSAYSSIK
jgi:hypothetical protein